MAEINSKVEEYLQQKNVFFDPNILNDILAYKKKFQNAKDEDNANYYWLLEQIFLIQRGFVDAFEKIKKRNYEDAWVKFDEVDIKIGSVEQNFKIDNALDKYHLCFIGQMIKEYQKLFPYKLFLSRESVIKKEKCNICGKEIKLRDRCRHVPGKIYCGELCLREVMDFEIKKFVVVSDPFDKYCFLKIVDQEYDYSVLEKLTQIVKNPYEKFSVEVKKIKSDEYKNIGRNEVCPCGSGKKYKNCHLGTADEMMDYMHIVLYKGK